MASTPTIAQAVRASVEHAEQAASYQPKERPDA